MKEAHGQGQKGIDKDKKHGIPIFRPLAARFAPRRASLHTRANLGLASEFFSSFFYLSSLFSFSFSFSGFLFFVQIFVFLFKFKNCSYF
jgi:hypothetical protein